jgi:hypothetical protein
MQTSMLNRIIHQNHIKVYNRCPPLATPYLHKPLSLCINNILKNPGIACPVATGVNKPDFNA